jgi:hypothetical protein
MHHASKITLRSDVSVPAAEQLQLVFSSLRTLAAGQLQMYRIT